MNTPWCVDVWRSTSSLRKKNPWIGTTGAGQNCPERESESPGEDVIFDDWVSVLSPWFSPFQIDFSSFLQEPSVSEPRHLSLCCSVSLQSSTMFCQTVLSVKKRQTQGNKQRLRRAPCRRHACALHGIAPAAAERRSFVCLRKRNGCMQHEHLPNLSPGPCLFFVSSVFIRQLLSEGVVEKNCKQLVQNTQFS